MSNFTEERLAICNGCEYNMGQMCILCGCDLNYKTVQSEEFCPLNPPKWGVVGPVVQQAIVAESTAPSPPAPCLPCQAKNR
jgi:hypothetical protein